MRKGRLCIALMALTLLFVGCQTPDENADWSPGEDFPDWTYDKPIYTEPVDDVQPLETVGNDIPVYYSRNDIFFVRHPVKRQEDVRPRLAVWASDDEGLTWRKNGHYGLFQKYYTFSSDHDARYWVRFVGPGVDPKTAEVPPGQPHRVYVVDTEAPEIFIRLDPPPLECECVCNCTGKDVACAECEQAEQEEWTSYGATNPRACQHPQNEAFYEKCSVKTLCKHREARPHVYHVGDRVMVHWTINDMNIKPETIELSTCFANFPHNLVWSRFKDTLPNSGSMEVIIPPEAVLQSGMRFRVVAEDKAGNIGLAMSEIMQVEEAGALEAPETAEPTAETATAPEPEEEIEPAAEDQPKSQQLFKVSAPTTSSRPTPPPPTDLTEPILIEKPAVPARTEPAPAAPPAPETKPTPAIEKPTTLSALAETQESETVETPTTQQEAPLIAPARAEETPSPAKPASPAPVEEPKPVAEPAPVVTPAPTPTAVEPKPEPAEPAPAAKPAPVVAPAEKPAPAAEEKPSIPSVAVMEQKAPPAAPVVEPEPQKQPAEEKTEAAKPQPRPEKLGIQPVKPTEPLAMAKPEPQPTVEPVLKPAERPSTAPTTMKLSDIPEKVQQGWPAKGTTLRGGMSRLLNWLPASAAEYKNAELQFSSNGGQTWTTVGTNLKPGRAIMWTVPAATSKNCLLRVVGLDDEGKSAPLETSETFSVDTGEWETIDMSGFRMEVPKPK